MSNLTAKEWADKTVKDLKKRKIEKAKKKESDVIFHFTENKQKAARKKIGQFQGRR
jgi:predicted secreted acid phosphatase